MKKAIQFRQETLRTVGCEESDRKRRIGVRVPRLSKGLDTQGVTPFQGSPHSKGLALVRVSTLKGARHKDITPHSENLTTRRGAHEPMERRLRSGALPEGRRATSEPRKRRGCRTE